MIAFLSLLFILLVIYFFTTGNAIEGFDPVNKQPEHKILIPSSKIPVALPPANATQEANVRAHEMPGQLPVAPYGQVAAMSPLPYQDTTLIKANRQQIISLLEMLKGFLAFEAQSISERSDPSVQLPLSTSRSDFHLLESEAQVLNRNPGVQSNITLSQLNEMSSNLAFLQRAARIAGSAGAIQGPINEFTKEGFVDAPADSVVPASMYDLKEFTARIQGEILRLSASASTDPIMNARVNALTKMKADVSTIIDQVEKGMMMEVEIPIMKSDINKSLPILGKPSEPLPQLIKVAQLPAGLANILPSNVQKDPDTTRQISSLLDSYAQQFIDGLSTSVAVSYMSKREAQALAGSTDSLLHKERARALDSTVNLTGFPSSTDLKNIASNPMMSRAGSAPITDSLAPTPLDAGRGPSQFDWKERAKHIESQIKKRGLTPSDYGIMVPNTRVSDDFSWKGYARMICSRLQATMDPALPETCGCPPMDWKGWRIAK